MSNAEAAERAARVFTPNYRPAPIVFDKGEGVFIDDVEGHRYLDMVSGIAVSALGHGHPQLIAALKAQAEKVLHTSNLYLNAPSIELAERLVAFSALDRVYFCNSGAEANESVLKLARRFAWDRGEKTRTEIISFEGSFHGRTYGALTATAQPKYHEGFGPMPGDFTYLPFGNVAAVEAAISDRTAAVIIEPIQGEGGVRLPPPGYLKALRDLTERAGALLIFDEVQVGIGRTGHLFGYEASGVVPDLLSLAKGLGAGMPLGAMLACDRVAQSLVPGTHATTFGGNPMATRAGTVVLDVVLGEGFLERVCKVGERLRAGLTEIGTQSGAFGEVRGAGLIIGAQLSDDIDIPLPDLVAQCRRQGVLVHIAGPRVLRLVPPLILEMAEAEDALVRIGEAVRGWLGHS